MGQVTVTLNGRTFRLACAEEAHVLQLADEVGGRAQAIIEEFGQMSDDRVLLLAAIMLADELMQARLSAGA